MPLEMIHIVESSYSESAAQADSYLSSLSVTREDLSDGSGVVLTWFFSINENWPESADGIDFELIVSDVCKNVEEGQVAGTSFAFEVPHTDPVGPPISPIPVSDDKETGGGVCFFETMLLR